MQRNWNLFGFFLIVMVVVVILGTIVKFGWWDGKSDYRLAVFANDGMALISISPHRSLVTILSVPGETKVWIPQGMGWYQVDRLVRIFNQENKWGVAPLLAFFNFGFGPTKILIVDQIDSWDSWSTLVGQTGLLNGVRLKAVADELLLKTDQFKGEITSMETLGLILARDYADTDVLAKDVRISVVNSSGVNGVADWLSKRLTWAGMTVVETMTGEGQKGCTIRTAPDKEARQISSLLGDYLLECKEEISDQLGSGQIEIIIGEDWVKMLQYANYVGTF